MAALLRQAQEDDHPAMVSAVQRWWGDSRSPEAARELSLLLPRLFLQHFARTSLVFEASAGLRAFLVGFHSADRSDAAYVHFVGVDPEFRGRGIAGRLYAEFVERARQAGRHRISAITSPTNTSSIAFHQRLGFTIAAGPDGGIVHRDYDGPGQDRVCFERLLG